MLGTKMYCYLNLRDFDNAQKLAKQSEEYFIYGSANWFLFSEYYYVLSLQTKNYQVAYNILKSAIEYHGFERQPKVKKQKWEILRAYMEFVIVAGIWSPPKEDNAQIRTSFKISRFINEFPIFQKDKTGVNVSILMLQILFLLQKGDFLGIINRKDALVRYIRRYLYTKENERSRVFMLHLAKMIQYGFNAPLLENKLKRLTYKMKKEFSSYASNMGGNEVLDYEMLWEWILKELRNKTTIIYEVLQKEKRDDL